MDWPTNKFAIPSPSARLNLSSITSENQAYSTNLLFVCQQQTPPEGERRPGVRTSYPHDCSQIMREHVKVVGKPVSGICPPDTRRQTLDARLETKDVGTGILACDSRFCEHGRSAFSSRNSEAKN